VPYEWPGCVQKRAEAISQLDIARQTAIYHGVDATSIRSSIFAKCHFYASCSVGAPVSGLSLGWLLVSDW